MQAKLPPHSIESEQAVLGGLLLDNRAWSDIADILRADDFYRDDHRLLFQAIADLADEGKPADSVTVVEALRERDQLGRVPPQYVGQLAADTPSAANIKAYAETVRDRAVLRGLIGAGTQIIETAYSQDGTSATRKLDAAESAVGRIREGRDSGQIVSAKDAANRAAARMEEAFRSTSDITGLATSLVDLDRMTGGLQNGDLVILAARPSMGKTALALQWAYTAAMRGEQVAFFSLEMPVEQLVARAQSFTANVPLQKILRPKLLVEDEWTRINQAMPCISNAAIDFVDMPGMVVTDIRAKARQIHRRSPLRLVVVDYLQLIPGDGENRNQEISKISGALKQLARELRCPVVCLSQLSRRCEERPKKRPIMSDLRDGGSIEQDADDVFFVYRDEVYRDDSPHEGVAEIIIGKQRNGPIGHIDTRWNGPMVHFSGYAGPTRSEREREAKSDRKVVGMDY